MTNLDPELEARLVRIEQAIGWLIDLEQRRQQAASTMSVAVQTGPVQGAPGATVASTQLQVEPVQQAYATQTAASPATGAVASHAPVQAEAQRGFELSSTTLVAGVGGAIFLAGAIFLLSYSIQQGWVGEELRFIGALIAGVGLTALATKLMLGTGRKIGVSVLLAGLGTLQLAFRVGAIDYQFFPPMIGFAGVFVGTVFAGALAARARSGGAMTIALISGLLAPMAFSQGGHHEIELAGYLALLMASALVVPLASGQGGDWKVSRWLAVVGTWLMLAFCVVEVHGTANRNILLALLVLHHALAGVWIWLPGRANLLPKTPTTLWMLVSLAASSLGWQIWDEQDWPVEFFSIVMVAYAAAHLALVPFARRKMGSGIADTGLLALAGGHLALAVPVALDWQWVGAAWGVFALGCAWAASRNASAQAGDERRAFTTLALGFATIASLHWLTPAHWFLSSYSDGAAEGANWLPFINPFFVEGLLATAAWALLIRVKKIAPLAFFGGQIVGALLFSREIAGMVYLASESTRAGSISSTLVFAFVGAAQWIASLRMEKSQRQSALTIAGYAWLGVAAVKLLVHDLADADTPLRAIVFLGVGAIFLAAAVLGHRLRGEKQ